MNLRTLVAAAMVVSAVAADAQLTGQIAYTSHARGDSPWVIHIMNPDGSGRRALTDGVSPSWSPDGERIVYRGRGGIWVMDRDGSANQLLFEVRGAYEPVFSHDGRKVFFNWSQDDGTFIYSIDATTGGEPVRLPLFPPDPADVAMHWDVTPSPDGQSIAFSFSRPSGFGTSNPSGLYVANIDGSDIRLVSDIGRPSYPAWSPDGNRLAFHANRDDGEGIYVASADGTDQTLLSAEWALDWSPTWSPDGGWIAFMSTQNHRSQDVYIMRPDGSGITNLTNSDGSTDYEPAWSPVPLPALPTAVVEQSWGQIKPGN